jgi:hypothetical protein
MLPYSSMRTPTPSRPGRYLTPILALVIGLACGAGPLVAQEDPGSTRPPSGSFRVGLSLGGTGFVGLTTEFQRSHYSVELTLGTITFREVAVSLAGKRYFSQDQLRPAVGLGLWSLSAWTEDGSGSVLILRMPFTADWNWAGGHATGIEVALNRALAVNRLDPEDDTPPNTNIVPFPGLYYRFGFRR